MATGRIVLSGMNQLEQKPQLYLSSEHPCSYLPRKQSRTLFLEPCTTLHDRIYNNLIDQGFRRSGEMIYRPECDGCNDCISLRLPVDRFQPRRIQRRIERRNTDVEVSALGSGYSEEQYQLYKKYIRSRHPQGSMADLSAQQYIQFLTCRWSKTLFFEFRLRDRLQAVAVTDLLPQGLSAVYTFFDPDLSTLSPGVYTILWQIEEAKRRGLKWLYLGYWIPKCRKMEYKDQYRPVQAYLNRHWHEFPVGSKIRE